MMNRDKRSLVFSLALGDGCLHYLKSNGRIYGSITIDHGIEQSDYQAWKAKLLSEIFNRDVKVRTGHKGKSVQVSVCDKKLRVWRKWCYPNNKKDVSKMLKYLRHPEMALAVWLMDDGYAEPSFSKLSDGSKKNYGARLRIFTCDQSTETHQVIIEWFQKTFGVTPKIKMAFKRSTNKHYPFLKFSQEDSLKIWAVIREFILQFHSMRHKFRHMEQTYQYRLTQRVPAKADDIVHKSSADN